MTRGVVIASAATERRADFRRLALGSEARQSRRRSRLDCFHASQTFLEARLPERLETALPKTFEVARDDNVAIQTRNS
jgi:hypothetical protein